MRIFCIAKDSHIFPTKNNSGFDAKDSHIFPTKNNSGFDNVVGIYLTRWPLNGVVKLTML